MIKNGSFLNLANDTQYENEVFMTLEDNGDWEYTRLGFGEDHIGLYIVDLDDTGEDLREKIYVNPKWSVQDVLKEGVEFGVFEKYEDGTYAYRMDENAPDVSFYDFLARII